MLVLTTSLLLLSLTTPCFSQGAPWTEEETLIIRKKIEYIFTNPNQMRNAYEDIHGEIDYPAQTSPTAPKMLRLAFHDCMPYTDGEPGELSGCDGCLNPEGMMIDLKETYHFDRNTLNAPDVTFGNNNGLMATADMLEEIYTNPTFPSDLEALQISMKESGKSRADLWAFAGLVAAEWGINVSNAMCKGENAAGSSKYYAWYDRYNQNK